jgi:hypothetical protein
MFVTRSFLHLNVQHSGEHEIGGRVRTSTDEATRNQTLVSQKSPKLLPMMIGRASQLPKLTPPKLSMIAMHPPFTIERGVQS